MEYQYSGNVIGYGDDVLQMLDAIASSDIGRHRQTEALLLSDRKGDVDLALVMDECVLVRDEDSLPEPVRACARAMLSAVGVDPETTSQRPNAGEPMLAKLRRKDNLRERADVAKDQTAQAASSALKWASRKLGNASERLQRGDE